MLGAVYSEQLGIPGRQACTTITNHHHTVNTQPQPQPQPLPTQRAAPNPPQQQESQPVGPIKVVQSRRALRVNPFFGGASSRDADISWWIKSGQKAMYGGRHQRGWLSNFPLNGNEAEAAEWIIREKSCQQPSSLVNTISDTAIC